MDDGHGQHIARSDLVTGVSISCDRLWGPSSACLIPPNESRNELRDISAVGKAEFYLLPLCTCVTSDREHGVLDLAIPRAFATAILRTFRPGDRGQGNL